MSSEQPIIIRTGSNTATEAVAYQIARRLVQSDQELFELQAYQKSYFHPFPIPESLSVDTNSINGKSIYSGSGWIADRWRKIECNSGLSGFRLTIEGIGVFSIDCHNKFITPERIEDQAWISSVNEALLGPCLILTLALQGVWCLHASAVAYRGRVIAFASESGNGKSTLAAYLSTFAEQGWQLVADDILPVELISDIAYALPHYPQMKMPVDQQPGSKLPEIQPLGVIYIVEKPSEQVEQIHIQPMRPATASLALVRHTVASLLFDPDLLTNHLNFCSQAAQSLPVRQLVYPRQLELLPQLCQYIKTDIQSLFLNKGN